MLPLKDENPTRTRPFVTWAVMVACIGIYFLWQPSLRGDDVDDVEFTYRYAAIPCEVKEGRPLTSDEAIRTVVDGDPTACEVGDPTSPEVFPDKSAWLALLTSMFLHGGPLHLCGQHALPLGLRQQHRRPPRPHAGTRLLRRSAGLVASGAHIALNLDSTIPVVGASGAIAGVMGAYLVWFPNAPVRTHRDLLLHHRSCACARSGCSASGS